MTLTLHKPRIAVLATLDEYLRVSAATEAHMQTVRAENFFEIRRMITGGGVDGAVLSAAQLTDGGIAAPLVADLVRAFPAIAFVGLVDDVPADRVVRAGHLIGRVGIQHLADTRYPDGYEAIRAAFDSAGGEVFALRAVRDLLANCGYKPTPGWVRFLQSVFRIDVLSAEALGDVLEVLPNTVASRFFRAELPGPKKYIAYARLAWFAHLAEQPGLSLATIADKMQCSSGQSLGRTVRLLSGLTAAEFRAKYVARDVLGMFRTQLLDPYIEILATFDPLADAPIVKRTAPNVAVAA